MEMSRLLTARELAKVLNVSVPRVYEMVRLGLIDFVKLGRQVRFSPEKVQEWIDNGGASLPGIWKRDA